MSITLGIVMDPIHAIKPAKDSSLGLLLAAQARGWSLAYIEPNNLMLDNQGPKAFMHSLEVADTGNHWFTLKHAKVKSLTELSVIAMRKDPPVDRAYLHITHILEKASQRGTLVINHPQSLRDFNEKLLCLEFPQYCPDTLVTQSLQEAQIFLKEQKTIVAKPLDGMGGQSIFRVHYQDMNQTVIFETLMEKEERYFMLQRYIPQISQGDKRIIMIHGEPMPYALARIPNQNEHRANLAAGGMGKVVPLTKRDLEISHSVGPFLKAKGLVWAGLDIIGDYLTEINITSPTCVREIEKACPVSIYGKLLDFIEQSV